MLLMKRLLSGLDLHGMGALYSSWLHKVRAEAVLPNVSAQSGADDSMARWLLRLSASNSKSILIMENQ